MGKGMNMTGEKPLYLEADSPVEKRVDDLLERMTVEEKISQMMHSAKAIELLAGIPASVVNRRYPSLH
jgi:beta-glucosidase